MNEAERIATELSNDFRALRQHVQGNGSKEGCLDNRINILEVKSKKIISRLELVEAYPCKDGCLFEAKQKKEDDLQNKKRTFRMGDIANYIQLAVLFLIVYGMFFQ